MAESSAPGFKSNFFHDYQVTIPRPISEVFRILGTSEGVQRVTCLSKLTTKFDLDQTDNVAIAANASLTELSVRSLPAAPAGSEGGSTDRQLPRQFFRFTEVVPILGVSSYNVQPAGTLTWDQQAKIALYETRSHTGILIWKLRTFEEIDDNTTKVKETIRGLCPKWLKPIVQKTTTKSHKAHMESYHTLFE